MISIVLTDQELDPQECSLLVASNSSGGTVLFIGTVRDHTEDRAVKYLDFEAYKPMAISEMQKIAEKAIGQWPVEHIAIHHRIGKLEISEIAVIIAVSTPHRKEAFEACQFCIDTLKETVPIWKKEVFEDGEVWVSSTP